MHWDRGFPNGFSLMDAGPSSKGTRGGTPSVQPRGQENPGLWSMLPEAFDVMREAPGALPLAYRWRDRGLRFEALGRMGLIGVLPVVGVLDCEDLARLRRALDGVDHAFRALVLEVDSPGGTVEGLELMGARVRSLRQRCRVVSVVTGVAAGSALWLAAQASEVFASPSARVGCLAVQGGDEEERRRIAGDFLAGLSAARGRAFQEGDMDKLHPARKAALIGLVSGVQTLDETIRRLAKERPRRAEGRSVR